MRQITTRICASHQCPMIIIDDLGYDIVACLVDWMESLIGRAVIIDVLPGGPEGVQLIFDNGVALPLLSGDERRVVKVADANVLLENVAGARLEQVDYQLNETQTALVLTFRKPNGDVLIVETHPASAIQMGAPRVTPGDRLGGIV